MPPDSKGTILLPENWEWNTLHNTEHNLEQNTDWNTEQNTEQNYDWYKHLNTEYNTEFWLLLKNIAPMIIQLLSDKAIYAI